MVVLVGAAWLLWWSGWLNMGAKDQQAAVATSSNATTTEATSTPAVQPLNGMSAANDTSDAAVAQDALALDAQLAGLTKDGSQVAASLSDKPITQSY